MITAIVLIDGLPEHIAELGPKLTDIKGVSEAHSVAGGDTDIVAILRVADHEEVAAVVTEKISKIPGVLSTSTMIAFRSYGDTTMTAAFEGFGD